MSRDQPFAYMDHEVGKPQGGHHRVNRIWSLRLQLEWFTATRYSNDNFVGLLRSLQKLDPHVSLNIEMVFQSTFKTQVVWLECLLHLLRYDHFTFIM